jgi:hypothetical protein
MRSDPVGEIQVDADDSVRPVEGRFDSPHPAYIQARGHTFVHGARDAAIGRVKAIVCDPVLNGNRGLVPSPNRKGKIHEDGEGRLVPIVLPIMLPETPTAPGDALHDDARTMFPGKRDRGGLHHHHAMGPSGRQQFGELGGVGLDATNLQIFPPAII